MLEAAATSVPAELGEFRIEAILGEGGSGTVFAATRPCDGEPIALKVLRADLALTQGETDRFLREAELMRRLAHPSIVPVLGAGTLPDGRPYLAMPRLAGETLAARLRRGRLPIADALLWFEQVADAVATLHDAGILHRDLKPENIFIVEDGARAVLLDFGIAKDADATPSTTTTEGRVRGTPAYMAPERFFAAPASVRSDVYELAVCLYEMLCGALPWQAADDMSARLDPQPGELSTSVWAVLRLALASKIDLRPASVRELAAAVRAARLEPTTTNRQTLTVKRAARQGAIAHPTRPHARRLSTKQKRMLVIRIGALLVLGIGVVALRFAATTATRAQRPASAATFCARHTPAPAFCADFEGPGDFRAGFVNAGRTPDPGAMGGGTIAVSPASPSSDPQAPASRSLALATPPLVTADNKASAALTVELPSPLRYGVIAMDLRIDTERFVPGQNAVALLLTLSFGRDAGSINLSRKEQGTQLTVYRGTEIADKALLGSPLPVGTWKTVKLLIHNYPVTADGNGEVFLQLDGLSAKLALPASMQQTAPPRLTIGIVAARGPMEAFRLNADNLAVTLYDGPPP